MPVRRSDARREPEPPSGLDPSLVAVADHVAVELAREYVKDQQAPPRRERESVEEGS